MEQLRQYFGESCWGELTRKAGVDLVLVGILGSAAD